MLMNYTDIPKLVNKEKKAFKGPVLSGIPDDN
jgi:hypothetical protein